MTSRIIDSQPTGGLQYFRNAQVAEHFKSADAYHGFRNKYDGWKVSDEPKHVSERAAANAALLRLKDVGTGIVQDSRFLSNFSVQYKNDDYIGTLLMPPVITGSMSGLYPKYNKRDRFAAPDDSMSGRSTANEITEGRTQDSYQCAPYSLKNHIDMLTLRNQMAPLDEMVDLTEAVVEMEDLKEEQRIASVMTTTTNYDTANSTTLTGANQWDIAGGGNPIKVLQDGRAALFNGHGPSLVIAWCGLDVWNVLSRHPAILDLFKYGGTAPGLAKPAMVAEFFRWDALLVSEARYDTANEGQTAAYSRIWGKNFGITRVAKNPSIRNAHFGTTFRFGPKMTRVWFDNHGGTEGGYYSQVSLVETHKVVANDTGFLVASAVS